MGHFYLITPYRVQSVNGEVERGSALFPNFGSVAGAVGTVENSSSRDRVGHFYLITPGHF